MRPRRPGVVLFLLTACFFYASIGLAQEEPEESAPSATEDDLGFGVEQLDLSRLINPEVRTASLIPEPVSEAPAPVTVITDQMIEAIGARNLQEILATYVPGMTVVADKNELNIAMRGIYTDSQQKILILIDGHRINSRLFSSAAPDFSIGIHPSKIRQIEVLRGPGSAIYGNLALNGVINIITKDAGQMNSATIEGGVSLPTFRTSRPDPEVDGETPATGQNPLAGESRSLTFEQRMVNVTIGESFGEGRDLKAWGSFYESEGQLHDVPVEEQFNRLDEENPTAMLGAFRGPASFDVGGVLSLGEISILAGARQGKMIPPFTSGASIGGQTYNYDQYRTWNGAGPGLLSQSFHSEVRYETQVGEWLNFHTGLYLDTNSTIQRLVIDPRNNSAAQQVSTAIGWDERTLGNLTHLSLSYDIGAVGAGSFLVGGQIDTVEVLDSFWITGTDGDLKSIEGSTDRKVLPEGSETSYSGFAQYKHAFGFRQDIILNLGIRYDYKDRLDYSYENELKNEAFDVGDDITALSPRMALIFAPDSWFGLKFSFSDSFVDAPFFNRNNRTRNFRGTPVLEPETMRAYQVTPTITAVNGRLKNSLNVYYLEHQDIIFRSNTLDPSEDLFQNSGELNVGGLENEFTFLAENYRIWFNASFQKPFNWTVYPVTDGQIDNVPEFFGNLTIDFKPLYWMTNKLWMGLSGRYYSEQTSPIDIFYIVQRGARGVPPVTREFIEPDNRVDDIFLLRATLRWNQIADTNFYSSLTVDNILDTTYLQGGTTPHPYRQAGRWFLLRAGYEFDR